MDKYDNVINRVLEDETRELRPSLEVIQNSEEEYQSAVDKKYSANARKFDEMCRKKHG